MCEREDKGHRCNGTNQTEVDHRSTEQNQITAGHHVLTLRHLTKGSDLEEDRRIIKQGLDGQRLEQDAAPHTYTGLERACREPRPTTGHYGCTVMMYTIR